MKIIERAHAGLAHHLPEDVMIEILCRLSKQSLVRFQCVCKAWKGLIYDVCIPRISPPSGFFLWKSACYRYQRERPPPELGNIMEFFPYTSDGDVDVQNVKFYYKLLPREYSPYDVLDQCHGLLLLVSKSAGRYFVCNPAIKQCVALPKQENISAEVRRFQAALAFHPGKSSHYKVVRFIYGPSNYPPEVSIFSSETKEWIRKKLVFTPPVHAFGFPWIKRTVYLDGMLYKLTFQKHLLCFDLGTLTVRMIDLPCADRIDEHGFIGVSKGNLVFSNVDGPNILIWQFHYYPSKAGCFWTLKHSICLHDLKSQGKDLLHFFKSYLTLFKIYAVHPGCDIVFLGVPTEVYSYNLQSHKLEALYTKIKDGNIILGQFFFYPYYPCYIRLNEFDRINSEEEN